MLRQRLWNIFRGKNRREAPASADALKKFRKRYAHFRKLLDANAALGELMADMARKLDGRTLFGSVYVQRAARTSLRLTRRMIVSLQGMRACRYAALTPAFERIAAKLAPFLPDGAPPEENLPLVLDMTDIDAGMVDTVGGKCASLGEMLSKAKVPVPRGFAVTLHAFRLFMTHTDLQTRITEALAQCDPQRREEFAATLERIRALIEAAPLPPALRAALEAALQRNFNDEAVRLAVRSSAQAEDGDKSFAGQFLSELGVARENTAQSYKRVVAGLFTPSAALYRLHQGIALSDCGMAVACLEMVDAVAAGVSYSHDPSNLLNESLIISGVWGLGRHLADGVVPPDTWVFTRETPHTLIRRKSGKKERKLTLDAHGEPKDEKIPPEEQKILCLSDAEALALAGLTMRLEAHYGCWQDVEWAKDKEGRLIFLQSRPLGIYDDGARMQTPLLTAYPLLLEGGDRVYPGICCGPVVMPTSEAELLAFPEGGVLAAAHSSAEYAQVLDRAQAVLTLTGGITGHMAAVCREFKVPTLLNVPRLLQKLKPGMVVTVDAFSRRVYEGEAAELLPMRMRLDSVSLRGTPVHTMLREACEHILPLRLTDPSSASFSPEGCAALHDIMRYTHERSYHEMFAVSDSASEAAGCAMRLEAPLPVDLHVIDLDKGARVEAGARSVTPEQISSAPLAALLRGMLRPDTTLCKPRPVNMGGFFSVMGQQMITPKSDERFGDKSYAVISDRYLNFSSRVGYHYSVLDAYCGNTTSKNYISFKFQGGAAGEDRRVRRCKAIGLVLEELGFNVRIRGDSLQSRFQKYEKSVIEDRLDQLGRLLQVTRQLDMLMVNDAAVTRFKEDFTAGIYK